MKDRVIEPGDLWSAARGLALFGKPDGELARIREAHVKSTLFASRVIVAAVDQVRAVRAAMGVAA